MFEALNSYQWRAYHDSCLINRRIIKKRNNRLILKFSNKMKNLSYTLWQIASWTSDESEVLIPALQRGLVWKPRQVELLWDSILRGFPIGSFMLSDIVNKEGLGKYYGSLAKACG